MMHVIASGDLPEKYLKNGHINKKITNMFERKSLSQDWFTQCKSDTMKKDV